MRVIAALLAAALLSAGTAGCGGSGAEPGAPDGATRDASFEASLMLDFIPNAVHSGIYAAEARGYLDEQGIDLTVREPGETTDAPKLLAAGKVDLAVMDIHDLGIAREQGIDLVGLMPIVDVPLASVIARADGPVHRPRDLAGATVGVTGLPSDEAVVDSEVSADGCDPAAVDRVTIGFNAVATLAAGKVDAATGFWNAEGVALRQQGVPIRVFKVDEYGAPRYPELVLVTSRKELDAHPDILGGKLPRALGLGYNEARIHPGQALDDLLAANPSLDRGEQEAQMAALADAFPRTPWFSSRAPLVAWSRWDVEHGILERPVDVDRAFDPSWIEVGSPKG